MNQVWKVGQNCIHLRYNYLVLLMELNFYLFQCRMRKISYKGKLLVTMNWSLNGKVQDLIEDVVGDIPILVKVSLVNLFLYLVN